LQAEETDGGEQTSPAETLRHADNGRSKRYSEYSIWNTAGYIWRIYK